MLSGEARIVGLELHGFVIEVKSTITIDVLDQGYQQNRCHSGGLGL